MAGNLYLEITNACVHGCKTCPHGTGNPRKSNYYISVPEMVQIVEDAIEDKHINSVTLSGGEPLMHPDILTIIKELSERNLSITLLSNLHYLNERALAEAINEITSNITFVTALHSATSERHDSITNYDGSFFRVLESVDTLTKLGLKVTIKSILCLETCEEISEIFKMCTNRWGKKIDFDFCGMDLCGADRETLDSVQIDFSQEAIYLNKVLFEAEQYYGNELQNKLMITEYPMCWLDPFYWNLIRRSSGERSLAFVGPNQMNVVDDYEKIAHCSPCSSVCKQCVVQTICPGLWPSILEYYGDSIIKPISKP